MEIKLWAHQEKAITEAKNRDFYGLFADPGTGKTYTTLEILREKYSQNSGILPTLIFCPTVVVNNWRAEILKYTKIKDEKIILLQGSQKQRIEQVNDADTNSVFVTNFEALAVMKNLIDLIEKKFSEYPEPCVLICDEVQKLKDPDSQRTKRAIKLSAIFKYRFILTGTPILNDLMDVYSQFRIMDQGINFGHNYYSFKNRFFYNENAGKSWMTYPSWKPKPGSEEKVREVVQASGMIAKKSDCLTLPPLVRKTIEVEMGAEQKRLYNSMKKDFISSFDMKNSSDEIVSTKYSIADLAITKALRLNQIVSGHIKLESSEGDDGLVVTLKDNPRKKALKELLEDLAPNHKVIVWSVFKANYDDIKEVCGDLKLGFAELTGQTKDKQHMIDIFQNDKDIRVLIGNPAAGGIGCNLTEASYMIYYSRGFSLEHDVQSEARNYRGGSEKHISITRIDLVCKDTIDQLVLESLSQKQQLSDKILRERMHDI